MTLNKLVSCLGVVVGLSLMASPVTAQPTSEVPRTTWGAPDLQGVWDYRTLTPLERPDELEGRESLTDEELAAFTASTLERRNNDQRREGEADVRGAYNDFWLDYRSHAAETGQTALIVDPRDGKIPARTAVGEDRFADIRARRSVARGGPRIEVWPNVAFSASMPGRRSTQVCITTIFSCSRARITSCSWSRWCTMRGSFRSTIGRIFRAMSANGGATQWDDGRAILWWSTQST